MISHISIEDFATIENLDVDFHKGLNIITGETGAGKSVFLTAVSMALGSRADSSLVRTGSDRALIQMVAEYQHRDIIISREINASGKSLCKVDGEIVPLSKLAGIAQEIADIHGQYDTQYLLDPANHILLVDKYEKDSIYPIIKKVANYYDEYIAACKRCDTLVQQAQDNDSKQELLAYQIDEIEKANLIVGEDLNLKEELEFLKNKEAIYRGLYLAYECANGENGNALSGLDQVIVQLKNISTISKDAANFEDELSDLYYRFEDVISRLRDARDRITINSGDIDTIVERLNFIDDMKKKYNTSSIDEILNQREIMEHQLIELKNIDSDIASAQLEKSKTEEMLKDEIAHLTSLRRASATTLQNKIQNELDKLNFQNAQVSINIAPLEHYTPTGMDKVEFLLTTNLGEPLKPLAKIASGGELSRIMLAFKTIISDYDTISTMIFDEIDSGISGETASIVGKAMLNLGETHQIIAITHLPQIAACADHNYRIEKSVTDGSTYTTVIHLSEEEKVAEIARMLAGINISDITIQSAKEMIHISK